MWGLLCKINTYSSSRILQHVLIKEWNQNPAKIAARHELSVYCDWKGRKGLTYFLCSSWKILFFKSGEYQQSELLFRGCFPIGFNPDGENVWVQNVYHSISSLIYFGILWFFFQDNCSKACQVCPLSLLKEVDVQKSAMWNRHPECTTRSVLLPS